MKYNFLRFDKEKNIEVFENAGWHFNNIMSPEQISLKLKTFAHTEFNSKEFYSVENIRNKIDKKIDLFNRGHNYRVVEIDDRFHISINLGCGQVFYDEFEISEGYYPFLNTHH